jgi:hypothetical protein
MPIAVPEAIPESAPAGDAQSPTVANHAPSLTRVTSQPVSSSSGQLGAPGCVSARADGSTTLFISGNRNADLWIAAVHVAKLCHALGGLGVHGQHRHVGGHRLEVGNPTRSPTGFSAPQRSLGHRLGRDGDQLFNETLRVLGS